MKKLFTLTALLLLVALGAAAQEKKTWDFTRGLSAETIANLNADTDNWAANGNDTDGNTNNWKNHTKHTASEPWKANGEEIEELKGLLIDIGSNGDNSLHLATTKMRLTRKNTKITFPKLQNGQKITVVGRSANATAINRGIKPVQDHLVLVDGVTTDGACIFIGGQVEGSLGTYSFTWEVQTTETEPVDVAFTLTPEAGIDFTLFQIDGGDEVETANVAYLYNGVDDAVSACLASREGTSLTKIDVTAGTVTAEQLQQYDVTIVGGSVPADNAAVQVLKEAMPWTPVLNLNAELYAAWGYGTAVDTSMPFAKVKQKGNALLKDAALIEEEGIFALPLAEGAKGVQLGDYFAGDPIVAVAMDDDETAMIHTHNINHNGYVFLPFGAGLAEGADVVLDNAILTLQTSKKEITQTAVPTMSVEYQNMHTLVTVKAPAMPKCKVYYTTDGSDPTPESTLYTEPVDLYQACTMKAAAIAEGYTLSNVAEQAVVIKAQAAMPVISVSAEQGKSVVTITSDQAGATIYYNFSGANAEAKSAVYTEPIELTQSRTVYAFVAAEGFINSEVASQEVTVDGAKVRTNVLSHMDANSGEYNEGSTSTAYYFSWGKDKAMYPYYNIDTRKEEAGGVDPDTGDEVTLVTYSELSPEEEKNFGTGWAVRSRGQIVDWENLSTGSEYGNSEGYNYATVADENPDFPATKAIINLADKNTTPADVAFPYNAYIVSTQKFAGPFDVVLNVGSIVKPGSSANHQFVVQVAADGNVAESDWKVLGDTIQMVDLHRLTKNITRSYNSDQEVYVRVFLTGGNSKVGFYDIYIANNPGEEADGIVDVQLAEGVARQAVYSLNGVRQLTTRRGLNIVVGNDGAVRKVLVK